VVWDLCGRRPEPPVSVRRAKPRRKGKAGSRRASR
jgi:hypothetical protein